MFAVAPTQAGLQTSEGAPIPLRGVAFDVVLRDGGAQVTVSQHFQNQEPHPIEAVYSFPLPEGAAICGFEVRLGERVITGRVEEKEVAFARYDEAIQEGHGAYLIDQDRPNIFTISVGNLLPQQSVVVQIRYVQALETEATGGRFVIPTTISPRYVPLEQQLTAPASELLHLNPPRVLGPLPYGLRLQLELVTKRPLLQVESPSHPIRCTLTDKGARVELASDAVQLDQDFVLNYKVAKTTTPQVHLARDIGSEGFVAMVDFWPEFALPQRQPQEYIFILDRSASMRGESIQQAKTALLLCLKSLQPGDEFNIYGFGSTYEQLFPGSQPYTEETLAMATQYVQQLEADLGGTEIYPVLAHAMQHAGHLPNKNILLLTDGQVGNEQQVLELAQGHRRRVRLFPFGIGRGPNEYFIRALARATDGAPEFIFPGERIEPKVMQQFARIAVPRAERVHLDWGGLPVEMVTPRVLPPLFHGQRWTVYGRLSALQPAQVRLVADIQGQTYTWEATVDPAQVDDAPVVTLLFARSAIRDEEEQPLGGSQQRDRQALTRRQALVELGCRYQLLSSQTSFVAIERRPDGDKTTEIKLRRVPIAVTRGWGGLAAVQASVTPSMARPDNVIFSLDMDLSCDLADTGSDDDDYVQLIAAQDYRGYWPLNRWLVQALGWDATKIARATELLTHAGMDQATAEQVVATLLALETLHTRYSRRQVEWRLLAQKAETWLQQLGWQPPGMADASDPVSAWKQWWHQGV